MAQIPYDYPGDPELARLAAALGEELGTPTHASEDDHLPVYYATINLLHYLREDEKVVSVSVVQTGETDDFMTMGEAIGEAVARLERRAVVLASGGMSHTFWPLKQLPKHEASDPIHIITPEARAADEERLEWMKAGDHARIVDTMDAYFEHSPEGAFGHYLMMLGSIGGRGCVARGELFSEYENATGTGQVHVWFDRPEGGWTG
jgi:aromatic ring-opening dioxygenase catalytic subunit (LigB family)